MLKVIIGVTLVTLAVLAALFVRPDVFPSEHTYGVSVGTNSHYCSADLVGWHLEAICEVAS